ncbi:YopX family protein [Bacillus pumilus]|uniref:YopX family protein n=1 Tax=Bacillus pumilus TaxID=1408 RepID=UPI0011A5BC07|nr:YopX family protein [Bacillus pumilus]
MREIKFRAFEKHSQRMFYNVQSGIYMDPDEFESFNDILGLARYKVMQFTGLKDKNGDEIYEGDIYHQGDPEIIYLVVWHDTGLQGKQIRSSSYAGLSYWKDRIEVIGNIYQNPDLWEEAH